MMKCRYQQTVEEKYTVNYALALQIRRKINFRMKISQQGFLRIITVVFHVNISR